MGIKTIIMAGAWQAAYLGQNLCNLENECIFSDWDGYYLLLITSFRLDSLSDAQSICTWFLKNQVKKIKFDELDF